VIRFQAPQIPPAREIEKYFKLAEEARWYSNRGPCHDLLVQRLERYLGPGVHCVPVANATLGLMVAIRALVGSRPPRREVLMPSFTFAATADAVVWAGLEPVFVDVDPDCWHLDPAALESALSARAGSVGLVFAASTFGMPPPVAQREAWERVAAEAGVPLLVDSAAGFGAVNENDERLGRQGDVEIFSFHATKPFAIGEGGLVTTSDVELARRVGRMTNFGFEAGVVHDDIGLNAKLAEWPAATALTVLDGFEEVLTARRATAAEMLSAAEPHGFVRQGHAPGAAWQFVSVLAPSPDVRDAVLDASRNANIEVRSYFNVPLHRMPAFASAPVVGELRVTDDLATRVLSLPMANDLAAEASDAIVESLAAAVGALGTR
jgi:dTDP-4-amino-4,6-dideoxygalactose transaminase